ncbi:MAG: hypothetical protein ACRECT_05265 [Thermoplasmata archaeon]
MRWSRSPRSRRRAGYFLALIVGLGFLLGPAALLPPPDSGPASRGGTAAGFTLSESLAGAANLSSSGSTLSPVGASEPRAPAAPIVPVGLTLSPAAVSVNSSFWGTTITPRARLLPDEGEFVSATPTETVVWPGAFAGDLYDPISEEMYTDGGGTPTSPTTSEAQFVVWCKSINCSAIFQVPGEIDDPAFAAEVVRYTEVNLSFQPAYWEIGNEPQLWKHWDLPWNSWAPTGKLNPPRTPTPQQYATEVASYVTAMQAANFATSFANQPLRIVGIAAAARGTGAGGFLSWINETVAVDGPNISAIAFHEYPAGGGQLQDVTLAEFYASLTSPTGLPSRLESVRQAISYTVGRTCPHTCSSLPVLVTEVGTALSKRAYGQDFSSGFPGALATTAEMIQGLALNVSNADLYAGVLGTNNSWMNFTGSVRPVYVAYASILDHLGSEATPVTLSGLGESLFGIATLASTDRDRSDLLIVNANVTSAAAFTPQLPGYSAGSPVEVWYWNGTPANEVVDGTVVPTATSTTPAPVAQFFPLGLPANWVLPPQSLVLFESYPTPAAPVELSESGLPEGTFWFAAAASGDPRAGGNTSSQTLFLPVGPTSVTIGPVSVSAAERFVPEGADPNDLLIPLDVPAGGTNVSIPFVVQWALNVSADGSGEGFVAPASAWWNAGEPLQLDARPAVGYVLSRWTVTEHLPSGTTITNVTRGEPSISFTANGSTTAKAIFEPGFPVEFTETGLPSGIAWSVIVRSTFTESENVTSQSDGVPVSETSHRTVDLNQSSGSATDVIVVDESNATYGFSVGPTAGYRSVPVGANVTVAGAEVIVSVSFVPTPRYSVTFVETGLPSGTVWSITLPNASHGASVTYSSNGSTLWIPAEEPGNYGYSASSLPNYRAQPPSDGFNLTGPGLVVPLEFAPVLFEVVWEETGLGPNLTWSVDVNGQPFYSSGAWTTAHLMNGSYTFRIPNADDYVAGDPPSALAVRGNPIVIPFQFVRASFPVSFAIQGGAAGSTWTVRLGNTSLDGATTLAAFAEPNGSYTFNVTAPTGDRAQPSHGVLTVEGEPQTIHVVLSPVGPRSVPAWWSLVAPALLATGLLGAAAWATIKVGRRTRRRPGAPP